jgi:hypothetical protein
MMADQQRIDTEKKLTTQGNGVSLGANGIVGSTITDHSVEVIPSTIPVPQLDAGVAGVASGLATSPNPGCICDEHHQPCSQPILSSPTIPTSHARRNATELLNSLWHFSFWSTTLVPQRPLDELIEAQHEECKHCSPHDDPFTVSKEPIDTEP